MGLRVCPQKTTEAWRKPSEGALESPVSRASPQPTSPEYQERNSVVNSKVNNSPRDGASVGTCISDRRFWTASGTSPGWGLSAHMHSLGNHDTGRLEGLYCECTRRTTLLVSPDRLPADIEQNYIEIAPGGEIAVTGRFNPSGGRRGRGDPQPAPTTISISGELVRRTEAEQRSADRSCVGGCPKGRPFTFGISDVPVGEK